MMRDNGTIGVKNQTILPTFFLWNRQLGVDSFWGVFVVVVINRVVLDLFYRSDDGESYVCSWLHHPFNTVVNLHDRRTSGQTVSIYSYILEYSNHTYNYTMTTSIYETLSQT